MNIFLEVNRKVSCRITDDFLKMIAKKTVKKAGYNFLDAKNINLSLAFVAEKEIEKINKKYRKKNKATDILSFSEYENRSALRREKKREIFLGELIICCQFVKKSAKVNQVSFEEEMAYILSHGILHLLGFQHGREMFSIQKEIAEAVNF